jgi:hypothetical protein
MKYIFLTVLILFIYRVFFRPKVVVEHRHFYGKKPTDSDSKNRVNAEPADYEDIT